MYFIGPVMVVLFFVRPITTPADATIPRKVSTVFSISESKANIDLIAKIITNRKVTDKDTLLLSLIFLYANT